MAVVEANDEFAAVGPKPLQRMRCSSGKIPEIAGLQVADIRPSFRVENGDAAIAIGHDRPFGGLMPMQLPNSAGRQPHVDAGYLLGNRKIINSDLTRPASILNAL